MDRKKRILIVEDDKNIADIVEYNIQKQGYETEVAYDGEKGLALALSATFGMQPTTISLAVMELTFGLTVQVNVAQAILLLVAILIYSCIKIRD